MQEKLIKLPKSIFISYRRDDTAGYAGRLFDSLKQRCGTSHVFMDVTSIDPGSDFITVIQQAVSSCDALIALIGRQWLSITDAQGHRRLDNPQDLVRLEIDTALSRNIQVIPALVQGTPMPRQENLPNDLGDLARRNALELSDTRWEFDVERLIEVLNVIKTSQQALPTIHTTGRQDTLSTLHKAINRCHSAVLAFLSNPPSTREGYIREINRPMLTFVEADKDANIYLNQGEESILAEFRGKIGEAAADIWQRCMANADTRTDFSQWPSFDYAALNAAYDNVINWLRDALN